MERSRKRYDTKTLATMAMITALAYAVMAVCKLIPKVANFLSVDVFDAVLAMGGFLFGPVAAVLTIVAEAFLEAITISTTGWYGFLMNVISSTLLICPAAYIYRRKGKTSGAVIGLTVGVLFRAVGMIVFNYLVTPYYLMMYMGLEKAAADGMVAGLMPTIALFNLVKAVLNAALAMIIYPPVSTALRKANLVAPSARPATGEKRRFSYTPLVVSAVVLIVAAAVTVAMILGKI